MPLRVAKLFSLAFVFSYYMCLIFFVHIVKCSKTCANTKSNLLCFLHVNYVGLVRNKDLISSLLASFNQLAEPKFRLTLKQFRIISFFVPLRFTFAQLPKKLYISGFISFGLRLTLRYEWTKVSLKITFVERISSAAVISVWSLSGQLS